ncbi:hypothetical protein D8B45_07285 [Candidatus Gracilibacteria bacterium]|nr:MAG: hypothetical protein D8B45_07285 [Candidatus Gracilibacteria bacterium]
MQGEIKFAILLLCKYMEVKREISEIISAFLLFFKKKLYSENVNYLLKKTAQWQRKQKNGHYPRKSNN